MVLTLTRSIPLSEPTRNAWRAAGVHIIKRRDLNDRAVRETVRNRKATGLINLGNLDIDFSNINVPVFNSADSIRAVSRPVALRRTLPDFIPESSIAGRHWHKTGGFGGKGKSYHETMLGECAVMQGDVQQHVDGDEYRVITVGPTVVQASKKSGQVGAFEYEWVGVAGVKSNGIIPFLKNAVERVPGGNLTVFGWDIIVGKNGPTILECNTSPGVNEFTAQRIVNQIERMI